MRKHTDIGLNVLLPLLAGFALYLPGIAASTHSFISNYLADGLWAYAFMSTILIIWNRHYNAGWILLLFVLAAGFEICQYTALVSGTGDVYDVIIYYSFFSITIFLNRIFKPTFNYY